MKRHEALAGRPPDQDLAVAVLIKPCVNEFRVMHDQPRHVLRAEARDDDVACICMRRDSSANGPVAMALGKTEI